jgi:DNA-binding transcriptional MocR family regulator
MTAPDPAFSASGHFRNYLRINAGSRWSDRTRDALDLVAGMIRNRLAS